MCYAFIADIHVNPHALEAVLHDVKACGAERTICLGDIVGSVGQQRDPGPEAAWTLWDSAARTVTFRRVPYDHAASAAAITAAGLPEVSAQRLLP